MRFKYREGDRVSVSTLPGVWEIVCPAPEGGYWIRSHDRTSKALAEILADKVVCTSTRNLTPADPIDGLLNEQETLT